MQSDQSLAKYYLIRQRWEEGNIQYGYPIPNVYLLEYNQNWLLTLQDSASVYMFLDQTKKDIDGPVNVVVRSKCQVHSFFITDASGTHEIKYYKVSPEQQALNVVTCPSSQDELTHFVRLKIGSFYWNSEATKSQRWGSTARNVPRNVVINSPHPKNVQTIQVSGQAGIASEVIDQFQR